MPRFDRRPHLASKTIRGLCIARGRLVLSAAAVMLASFGATAHADDSANRGRVIKLQINTPGSEHHASFHGAITVRHNSGATSRYHWGGSTCPGQKLDDAQVSLLAQAHINRGRTWLKPFFVPSEGGDKDCLVAFELTG